MNTRTLWLAASLLGLLALEACSPPPMVLVDQKFFGETRTAKVIMQRNGEAFDEYLRVCNVDNTGVETNCKDTLVLDKVVPQSIY